MPAPVSDPGQSAIVPKTTDLSGDILVVGPAWVGDMVMAQALFMRLKQRYPDAAIDVLAPGWSLPILARMPEVRQGIELPLGHGKLGLGIRWSLGCALRGRYAQAIVLPGSWKSALVPFAAGVPRRTGFRREFRYGVLNDLRPLDRQQLPTTVQQFLALGEDRTGSDVPAPAILRPRLRADAEAGRALVTRLGLDAERPAIALMPGAEYGPAKRWPEAQFATLARELVAQGHQVWVLGAAKEHDLAAAISADTPSVYNLAGKTALVDVVDLLARAAGCVTNDSGLMHVAAAVGTPLVAIYGSSSPKMTPPLAENVKIVYLSLSCSPCFERECPLGHLRCLRDIAPSRVLAELRELTSIRR